MQDRYIGDLGDFGKYGMLRRLCQADEYGDNLKLGVVWYLVPDESHNLDGKHITYLEDNPKNLQRFKRCDPELYDRLKAIVDSGERSVKSIQDSGILPAETVFHDEPLAWPAGMKANSLKARQDRLEHRKKWSGRAYESTKGCDFVFFDPDNGLDTKVKKYWAKGPKFSFMDEVKSYYKRGQSLVIYQHANRSMKVMKSAERRLRQIREATGALDPFALQYRRGTARLFLVVPAAGHTHLLNQRCSEMGSGAWGRHFTNLVGVSA